MKFQLAEDVKQLSRDEQLYTQQIQYIQKQAHTDYLTELDNRRALERLIHQPDLTQAILVMIDLDHLKLINDTYGHSAGDCAIKGMSDKIRCAFPDEKCRKFRLGGDEFLVVLPSCTHKQAYKLATTLLEICKIPIFCEHSQRKLILGASIGIAHYQKSQMSFSEALTHADEMVYVAKRHGRNRIEMTLTPTIESLPIITDCEREQLAILQQQQLKIGYFDMLSESEMYYYQFLTEFLGLQIQLEKIEQHQYSHVHFQQFDALINAVSISVPKMTDFTYIPFELSPLIMLAHKPGERYSFDQIGDIAVGVSELLYQEVKEYILDSDKLNIFKTLNETITAFEAKKIQAIILSSYFFKSSVLKEFAVPVFRQEISNVTIGMAINTSGQSAVLASIVRKYLAAGGAMEFTKQTQNLLALRKKVQSFLTVSEYQLLKKKKQIRVYLQRNHGQFSRYNRNLDCYTGDAMHILDYLSQVLEIEFVIAEWNEYTSERSSIMTALENDAADLAFAILLPENRNEEATFFKGFHLSMPFAHTAPSLLTTNNREKLSFAHLSRIKVGILGNSYTRMYLDQFNITTQETVHYETTEQLVQALENYEIQAILVSSDIASELTSAQSLRIEYELPYYVERVVCAKESNHELIQIMNKALVLINQQELIKF